MILYHELKLILQYLENQVSVGTSGFRSYFEVSPMSNPIRAFALDTTTSQENKPLPVVITIGGNYTQDPDPVPPGLPNPAGVEEDLKYWRGWLQCGFDDYLDVNNQQTWVKRCAASALNLPIPDPGEYHLVMTNFCLWITRRRWSKIQSQIRADLLQSNANFMGALSVAPNWPHLGELRQKTGGTKPLWVGHGNQSEIFALFRQFIDQDKSTPWLLMPNVSNPYNYVANPFRRDD